VNVVIDIGSSTNGGEVFYCLNKCMLIKWDSAVWSDLEYYI
jgi:hypothetical protein